MKAYAQLKHPDLNLWPVHELRAGLRRAVRNADVNWYQVAVVAIATFAVAMDLMFPPVRVAIGQGMDVYAGHAYMPLLTTGAVEVDFLWLALELLAIIVAAIAGWHFTTPSEGRTRGKA